MKNAVTFALLLFSLGLLSQTEERAVIEVLYGGRFLKDESQFPGASVFKRDDQGQVHFRHKGADLYCDEAYLYAKENRLEALGNIRMLQGDTLTLKSRKLFYNGDTRMARAIDSVDLVNNDSRLLTNLLFFNREKQEAYFNTGGTLYSEENILNSRVGTYDMNAKTYIFEEKVHIDNPDFVLDSDKLIFDTTTQEAYMSGATTIVSPTYRFYFEQGQYNTDKELGYGLKNTRIDYDNRTLYGDSVYFDNAREYASATQNIKVIDSLNASVLKAQYVELFKAKDSMRATGEAIVARELDRDSLYVHGTYLFVTGKEQERDLLAFPNARFYKEGLSGASDSLKYTQKTGITELVGDPVLWNVKNQLTGDYMYFTYSKGNKAIDSLHVEGNAFMVAEDSIGELGYNQAKGALLDGNFINNKLHAMLLKKNTEVIYYMYDDTPALIGVNKTVCSEIKIQFANGSISDITFMVNPSGEIYPYALFPEEFEELEGFRWRGSERVDSLEEFISRIKRLKK
jgi:lipopolysaccharide export system protein LptA